jgi:hypothetical protein
LVGYCGRKREEFKGIHGKYLLKYTKERYPKGLKKDLEGI